MPVLDEINGRYVSMRTKPELAIIGTLLLRVHLWLRGDVEVLLDAQQVVAGPVVAVPNIWPVTLPPKACCR